jgi:para-nitrobenzyl esterase
MQAGVLTQLGRLEGDEGPHGVQVFRGIPFAQAPVGELRFRAPQPCKAWTGTRSARAFGASAPQDRVMADVGPRDEDCLFLNVWTPAVDTGRRPVMVWIHGGSFNMGSGSQPMYDAANLALRGNLVVVTINYRLGALGFVHLRELLGGQADRADANNGLRDQVAALRWVHENIAAFGGDPENVTVFGESAGAMSIGCLLAAPSARGLFRRAIAQSGAAHHALTRDHASQVAARFMRALGGTPEQPGVLWRATAEQIVAAQRTCASEVVEKGPAGKRLPQTSVTLMPVVDGDFLPEYPLTAIEAGCAADVELIVGTNLDEWNYFLFLTEPKKRSIDEAALHKICENRIPGHATTAVELYRRTLGAELPAWKIYSAIESDRTFRVPALRLAEAQARHNPRTFMYLFEHGSPLFQDEMGSCHALEIPFVFGAMDTPFARMFAGEAPSAEQLSNLMLDAWTGFARAGDPSHEALGRWLPYDSVTRQTMRFGARTHTQADPFQPLQSFWAELH